MISGRNIKSMSIRKAEVRFVSHLSIMDSTRTSYVEPRFVSFGTRESVWDVHLHIKDNNLRYAFGTKRCIADAEAVIIP